MLTNIKNENRQFSEIEVEFIDFKLDIEKGKVEEDKFQIQSKQNISIVQSTVKFKCVPLMNHTTESHA